MEKQNAVQNSEAAPGVEKELAQPDRRAFLRQAAAAGMGSAALALLLGAGGAERAEASNAGDMFSIEYVTLELPNANVVNFSTLLSGVNREAQAITQGGAASFSYFADGFPPVSIPIWGVWYQPFDNIQNLTQYKTIRLSVNKATAQVILEVAPTPAARDAARAGTATSSLTLQVMVLHGPF